MNYLYFERFSKKSGKPSNIKYIFVRGWLTNLMIEI